MFINVGQIGRRHTPHKTVLATASLSALSELLHINPWFYSGPPVYYIYFSPLLYFWEFSHFFHLLCPKYNVLRWSNCIDFWIILLADWLTDWLIACLTGLISHCCYLWTDLLTENWKHTFGYLSWSAPARSVWEQSKITSYRAASVPAHKLKLRPSENWPFSWYLL
jgi:hypothetical protein